MTDYRNRIVGLEYIPSDQLTSHPGNWRDHPKAQAEALRGVLGEVGIAGALLAYRSPRQNGALVVIDGHLRKDAAPGPLHVLSGQVLKERGIWRQTIQWVKNNATFAPLGVDYHWRAEPIFYGWLPNGAHRYYGGRKQDTVWEIDRPVKSPEHPTMKPVELVQRAIENHSRPGDVVADGFLGSGTTLIAAENLGRQCRAVELSPGYVAVALERYVTAFGIEPELID